MSLAKPSFYRLFRRSCYVCGPIGSDSAEAVAKRAERERFAVASLAFCLRHDEPFRRHFWTKICRSDGDPAVMPPIDASGIELEPRRWSDLRLIHENRKRRFVWVVEVKAGAPLAPRQNPNHPDFQKKDFGYGAILAAGENRKGTQMRYIMLGCDPSFALEKKSILGIAIQKRGWIELRDGFSPAGITEDLFACLGELQINPFYMEKAKKISVTSGIGSIGDAWTVLHAVCENLGIPKRSRDFQVEELDDGSTWIGIYIKSRKARDATLQKRLQSITDSKWYLGWLGYRARREDIHDVMLDAGFYCGNAARQKVLLAKLRKTLPAAEPCSGDDCIYLDLPARKSKEHFGWFESIFRGAIA